jgi:ribosomal protein S18 acetylase RimI-like enzyme
VTFTIEPLADRHDRTSFARGSAALDRYVRSQATKDMRRRVSACYAAVPVASAVVAGYYTISAAAVALDDLPEDWAKRLPRYPTIPAVRIGRLAVDRRFQRQGLGGILLADALGRALRSEIACHAAIVEAKDDAAVAFYRHHGFLASAGDRRTLFLPLARVRGLMPR